MKKREDIQKRDFGWGVNSKRKPSPSIVFYNFLSILKAPLSTRHLSIVCLLCISCFFPSDVQVRIWWPWWHLILLKVIIWGGSEVNTSTLSRITQILGWRVNIYVIEILNWHRIGVRHLLRIVVSHRDIYDVHSSQDMATINYPWETNHDILCYNKPHTFRHGVSWAFMFNISVHSDTCFVSLRTLSLHQKIILSKLYGYELKDSYTLKLFSSLVLVRIYFKNVEICARLVCYLFNSIKVAKGQTYTYTDTICTNNFISLIYCTSYSLVIAYICVCIHMHVHIPIHALCIDALPKEE